MTYNLNIYSDETYTEIERVASADELKIPYRVAMSIVENLDEVDLQNTDELMGWISSNIAIVDKIVKATFHVTDQELERVNAFELIESVKSLYAWTTKKLTAMKGNKKK